MSDLFPEDPQLALFSQRYAAPGFDPTAIRPIVSPSTQAKPKALSSIDKPPSLQNSPRPAVAQPELINNSPKRPLEDSDNESTQPRKVARGESPLKGAAGRRLDAQKRTQLRHEVNQGSVQSATPAPAQPSLPRDVLFLLSILPRPDTYNAAILLPDKMVDLLRRTDLSRATPQGRQPTGQAPPVQKPQYGYGQVNRKWNLRATFAYQFACEKHYLPLSRLPVLPFSN